MYTFRGLCAYGARPDTARAHMTQRANDWLEMRRMRWTRGWMDGWMGCWTHCIDRISHEREHRDESAYESESNRKCTRKGEWGEMYMGEERRGDGYTYQTRGEDGEQARQLLVVGTRLVQSNGTYSTNVHGCHLSKVRLAVESKRMGTIQERGGKIGNDQDWWVEETRVGRSFSFIQYK